MPSSRCCMEPILVADELASTHIGRPIHVVGLFASPFKSGGRLNRAKTYARVRPTAGIGWEWNRKLRARLGDKRRENIASAEETASVDLEPRIDRSAVHLR